MGLRFAVAQFKCNHVLTRSFFCRAIPGMSFAIALLAVAFPALEAPEGLNSPVHQDVVFEIAFLVEDFVTSHVSAQQHLPHALCFLAQNLYQGVVVVLLD